MAKNMKYYFCKKYCIVQTVILLISCMTGYSQQVQNADVNISPPAVSEKNVILITISTLRANHVTCLGYSRDTTPNYDEFAKQNILFTNAFATSGWMMPAHGSIFTSLYPGTHGATHIDKNLNEDPNTLAEILTSNGYCCAGFSCDPRLDREHGFGQGFDLYDDYSVLLMLDGLTFGTEKLDINKQRTNALINDAAIGWLNKNTHKPFFLFVHYYDNHWDYLPPSPYDKLYDPNYNGKIDGKEISKEPLYSNPPDKMDIEHIIALYDGEVKQTDSDLGEMLKYLKKKGFYDNSIIIVMSDHGEQFYEHGNTSHQGLWDELVHIPLSISIPGASVKDKKINSLISQMDIMPTILDYLGMPIPVQCRGKSFKPVIEGKAESINDYVFMEYTAAAVPDIFAARSLKYKCYKDNEGNYFSYDLENDSAEQKKILPDKFPDEVKKLKECLDNILAKIGKK